MNKNNFLALAVGAVPPCAGGAWPCGNGFYEYDSWRSCLHHFFMWWDWLSSNLLYVDISTILRSLSPMPLSLPWFRECDIADELVKRIGCGMAAVDMECMCSIVESLQSTAPDEYHLRRHEIIEEYMNYAANLK